MGQRKWPPAFVFSVQNFGIVSINYVLGRLAMKCYTQELKICLRLKQKALKLWSLKGGTAPQTKIESCSGFEWLIFRLGEVIEIFKTVKSHGKSRKMEIYHKHNILAQLKMTVVFWCTRNRPFVCAMISAKRSWNCLILSWKSHVIFKNIGSEGAWTCYKHKPASCNFYFSSLAMQEFIRGSNRFWVRSKMEASSSYLYPSDSSLESEDDQEPEEEAFQPPMQTPSKHKPEKGEWNKVQFFLQRSCDHGKPGKSWNLNDWFPGLEKSCKSFKMSEVMENGNIYLKNHILVQQKRDIPGNVLIHMRRGLCVHKVGYSKVIEISYFIVEKSWN